MTLTINLGAFLVRVDAKMCVVNVGGCILQAEPLNQFDKVTMTFIRLLFPIWFAYLMIMVAFRIGVKKKRDR